MTAAIQAWEPVVPDLPSAAFSECRPRTQALGSPFPGLAKAAKAGALYACKVRLKSGALGYGSKEFQPQRPPPAYGLEPWRQ